MVPSRNSSAPRGPEDGRTLLPPTRAHAVAAELRRLIEEREFPPGAHLRQAEIAKRFGVSTTPVREAFTVLAREGIVQQDAHRGVIVFDPSLEELTENYEIREALEALASELAAPKLEAEDLDELERLTAAMKAAYPADVPALNYRFHTMIYAATGRERLAEIIDNLRKASTSYVSFTVRHYDPRYAEEVQVEHEAIVAALRERDGGRAGSLMRAHLGYNRRHVAGLIESAQGAP